MIHIRERRGLLLMTGLALLLILCAIVTAHESMLHDRPLNREFQQLVGGVEFGSAIDSTSSRMICDPRLDGMPAALPGSLLLDTERYISPSPYDPMSGREDGHAAAH
jgi:hypothetical protein